MLTECHAILPFIAILFSASLTYYIYSKNRRYDIAKEKLKNLYNPLNALIEKQETYLAFLKMRDKNRYAIEYYKFFLELRDIYLDHVLYGTMNLKMAFHVLQHAHEIEYHRVDRSDLAKEEMIKSIVNFEFNHKVDKDDNSEFERKMEELIQAIREEQSILNEEMNFNSIFNKKGTKCLKNSFLS